MNGSVRIKVILHCESIIVRGVPIFICLVNHEVLFTVKRKLSVCLYDRFVKSTNLRSYELFIPIPRKLLPTNKSIFTVIGKHIYSSTHFTSMTSGSTFWWVHHPDIFDTSMRYCRYARPGQTNILFYTWSYFCLILELKNTTENRFFLVFVTDWFD